MVEKKDRQSWWCEKDDRFLSSFTFVCDSTFRTTVDQCVSRQAFRCHFSSRPRVPVLEISLHCSHKQEHNAGDEVGCLVQYFSHTVDMTMRCPGDGPFPVVHWISSEHGEGQGCETINRNF